MIGGGPEKIFKVTKRSMHYSKLFKVNQQRIEIETTDPQLDNYLTAGRLYYDLFDQILKEFKDKVNVNLSFLI